MASSSSSPSDRRSGDEEEGSRHWELDTLEKVETHGQRTGVVSNVDDVQNRPAPDGGFEAWLVVFGAWCTSFCSFGWLNSVGVFQDYYQRNNLSQYSASQVAWIPSLQIFFLMATTPFVGYVFDRHGPRWLMIGGMLLHVFGLMMLSLSDKYYQILLSQGVCSAIGAAAVYQPAFAVVGGWFENRKAAAFGALTTGSSLGGVIFPIMLTHLIPQVGFGWALRIAAFLMLTLLLIACLTVRCRIPPHPRPFSMNVLVKPLLEPKMLLVIIGNTMLTFGNFIPIDYIIVEAVSQGMSPRLAQYTVPILNAASGFGRYGSGLLGDRFGRYNVYITVSCLSAVMILAVWLPASNNAAIICFVAFFGLFSGAYISLGPALVAQISSYEELGYRIGIMYFFGSFAGLTTNPIGGTILQQSGGSFQNVKIYAGVICVAGAAFIMASRLLATGMKGMVKY